MKDVANAVLKSMSGGLSQKIHSNMWRRDRIAPAPGISAVRLAKAGAQIGAVTAFPVQLLFPGG